MSTLDPCLKKSGIGGSLFKFLREGRLPFFTIFIRFWTSLSFKFDGDSSQKSRECKV